MSLFTILQRRFAPPVPDRVRDAFTMLQFAHLQSQIPLLYLSLILLVLSATMAAGNALAPVLRFGVPLAVSLFSLYRILVWTRRARGQVSPEQARKLIRGMIVISGVIGSVCSFWCVSSWLATDSADKAYFALFMAMGSLSTAYCLSTVRLGALINLGVGMPPMIVMMLLSGERINLAAASSMIVAITFLLRMIQQQHSQLVALLELQHGMTVLADTDPLTSLANRRAIYARLDAIVSESEAPAPTLLLLDLDGFKLVNDTHGHAVGDEVLRQVAARFRDACDARCLVVRLGGDEFAVLIPQESGLTHKQVSIALLSSLVQPIIVDGLQLRIGASSGAATLGKDADSIDALFIEADRALYRAKAHGRARAYLDRLPSGASEALAS